MTHRLLIDQEWDGTKDIAHFDSDGNLIGREFVCDVEAVVDENKRRQNDGTKGWGQSRELRQIASIPPAILMKWAGEKGVPIDFMHTNEGFREIVLKMIKDPEYAYLRTDI